MNPHPALSPESLAADDARRLIDNARRPNHHVNMTTQPTREEIDAKFDRDQARMDVRFASLDGKIDTLVVQMAGHVAQMAGHERAMTMLSERAVAAAEGAEAASQRAAAAAEKAGGLKQTLWITSLTTILSVLAIAMSMYYGMQSANIGIVQTTISAFQAGQSSPAAAPAAAPAATRTDPRK